jgi:hypothetical protein
MATQSPEHAHASARPAAATPTPRPPHPRQQDGGQTDVLSSAKTAPPQSRCSKDVTAHPHRPGARPGHPCPVPACSGQPLPGKRRFSSPWRKRIFSSPPLVPASCPRPVQRRLLAACIDFSAKEAAQRPRIGLAAKNRDQMFASHASPLPGLGKTRKRGLGSDSSVPPDPGCQC